MKANSAHRELAQQEIKQRLKNGRLQGTFLLAGPRGAGKHQVAESLAQILLCLSGGETACGTCASCRQAQHNNHPDWHFLSPDESGTIKIEAVRGLLTNLSLAPMQAPRKVVILERAECLTRSAANALLKSLEEPGEQTVFFLLSTQAGLILPTIRSRCHAIDFKAEEVALRSLMTTWTERLGLSIPQLFLVLMNQNLIQQHALLQQLPSELQDMGELMTILRALCRDLLLLKLGDDNLTHALYFEEQQTELTKIAQAITTKQLLAIDRHMAELIEARAQKATPQLLWETLMLELTSTA